MPQANEKSLMTSQVPDALASLMKAKGQNVNNDRMQAQKPAAVIVENQHTEVIDTPDLEPEASIESTEDSVETVVEVAEEEEEATPAPSQEPVDTRDYQKSWIELKQYHDKTIHEAREKAKQLEEENKKLREQAIKPPKTAEEMKQLKENYGELFDVMETFFMDQIKNDTSNTELRQKIAEMEKAQAELREKEAFTALLQDHPDAEKIRVSPEFADWYDKQPADIQRIFATSRDPKAISKQLTLYKYEVLGIDPKGTKKAESQKKVEESLGVNVKKQTEITPQKKIWAKSEMDRLSADYKTWLKHKDEFDAARREGRVDNTK